MIYCKFCKQDKDTSEFCLSQVNRTNPKCRECITAYSKLYYGQNRIRHQNPGQFSTEIPFSLA